MKESTVKRPAHRSAIDLMIAMALAFKPASRRSGAMSALGDFTPMLGGTFYRGKQSVNGRRRHSGEVRRTKQHQRYRKFQMGLRS